jgi:hypothetical protein
MRLFIVLVVLVNVGCAALNPFGPPSVKIKNVTGAVSEIRSIVSSLFPEGVKSVSSNGRELTTKPFVFLADGSLKPYVQGADRYYAFITVLGDRRPYDLDVVVFQEKRVLRNGDAQFEPGGTDIRWAEVIAKKVQAELAKRRDDRNLIDDFRVY